MTLGLAPALPELREVIDFEVERDLGSFLDLRNHDLVPEAERDHLEDAFVRERLLSKKRRRQDEKE